MYVLDFKSTHIQLMTLLKLVKTNFLKLIKLQLIIEKHEVLNGFKIHYLIEVNCKSHKE